MDDFFGSKINPSKVGSRIHWHVKQFFFNKVESNLSSMDILSFQI